tara:strand:- start:136 stop:312 length:177 start_codon:yes stop_codon:yes gene_type:complete
MKVGDLVKSNNEEESHYGIIRRFFRHWEGSRLIYAAEVLLTCNNKRWFHVENLEVVCK